ncbi:peptidase inhibitor family I36 protein [Actinosynnema sp. NPDC002837]
MGGKGKRLARALVAVVMGALMVVPPAGVANAAPTRNGVCEVGEFCLYYLSYGWATGSAVSDHTTSIPEYGSSQPTCWEFKGTGTGSGVCVKQEAVSAWNRRSGTVRLYILPGCEGEQRWVIQPGQQVPDLGVHANRNQSHSVASSGTC